MALKNGACGCAAVDHLTPESGGNSRKCAIARCDRHGSSNRVGFYWQVAPLVSCPVGNALNYLLSGAVQMHTTLDIYTYY